jgi:glutathione S-transferase
MTELLGLPYSPWSEKARWALDARRVPYTFRHYQPLLGEPALRLKLRRPTGRVSVPVLTTSDGRVIADSADIARWAGERGEGPPLFPAEHEAAIARFIALSERALAAGRALSLARMLADHEALAEMVPGPIRRALGPVAVRIGALGIHRTLRKYGAHRDDRDAHRRTLIAALDELRAALAEAPAGEPKTLLGRFTFADIAAAQALAFVDPPTTGLKLGPASRRSFSDPDLRERHRDLLAWRDDLYRALRAHHA